MVILYSGSRQRKDGERGKKGRIRFVSTIHRPRSTVHGLRSTVYTIYRPSRILKSKSILFNTIDKNIDFIYNEFDILEVLMNRSLSQCPVCGAPLTVARYHCESCETAIEGHFAASPFPALAALTHQQMEFLIAFIRCEGKFNRLEAELGLSYPTLRNRLHELIRALGYEPGKEEAPVLDEARRRQVLEDLEAGRISAEQAIQLLSGEEA